MDRVFIVFTKWTRLEPIFEFVPDPFAPSLSDQEIDIWPRTVTTASKRQIYYLRGVPQPLPIRIPHPRSPLTVSFASLAAPAARSCATIAG
jgi:hypothetical protein